MRDFLCNRMKVVVFFFVTDWVAWVFFSVKRGNAGGGGGGGGYLLFGQNNMLLV